MRSSAFAAFVAFLVAPATGAASAQSIPQSSLNPRSIELFERDWALMHWATKRHDSDGNGILDIVEANRAAAEFKEIADGDSDDRVTPYEYDRAREFVIARY